MKAAILKAFGSPLAIETMPDNAAMLEELKRRFGSRVRTLTLTGDEGEDRERMNRAAPGPIDCVLDILPPSAPAKAVPGAAMAVRESGRRRQWRNLHHRERIARGAPRRTQFVADVPLCEND